MPIGGIGEALRRVTGPGADAVRPAISAARSAPTAPSTRSTLRPVAPPSDEELMERYAVGDMAAFDELFGRYAPTVLGLGRRHLGSDDAARELVQQTFLKLHGARRDYRAGQRLHPWLMTIVMNLVRDQWRRQKRKPTTALLHEPAAPRQEEGEGLERAARARELHAALAQLPPGQREVVELHWFQDRSFSEVASIVGGTEGAARVRAHRAYDKLKRLLGAKTSEGERT